MFFFLKSLKKVFILGGNNPYKFFFIFETSGSFFWRAISYGIKKNFKGDPGEYEFFFKFLIFWEKIFVRISSEKTRSLFFLVLVNQKTFEKSHMSFFLGLGDRQQEDTPICFEFFEPKGSHF